MRWSLLFAALVVAVLAAACGDASKEPDAGFDPDADIYPPDHWDPGDKAIDPCVGADGGADGCVTGPVDCARGDCVHGTCVDVPGGLDRCDCFEGYAGELCDRCAEGFVARGLECIPAGGCADDPCVHGTCRPGAGGAFTCDCHAGYAGALCDRCDDGYHIEDLRCVPD